MSGVLKGVTFFFCIYLIVFTLYPTGTDASEVLQGYNQTLSYMTSESGSVVHVSSELINDNAGQSDPYLDQIQDNIGAPAGYIWCLDDGTPIDYKKSSSFPRRGKAQQVEDNTTSGAWHLGTDIVPADGIDRNQPIRTCALFAGTVLQIKDNMTSSGWGHYVVIDHGGGFYTRYAHLSYGRSNMNGSSGPSWQNGKTGNSANDFVKVGDHVEAGDPIGYLGNTGGSTGTHGHIELILAPLGFDDGRFRAKDYWYAGVDHILHGKMSLNQLTWHNAKSDKSGYASGGAGQVWDQLIGEGWE